MQHFAVLAHGAPRVGQTGSAAALAAVVGSCCAACCGPGAAREAEPPLSAFRQARGCAVRAAYAVAV